MERNKTCGECRFYNEDFNLCLHWRYEDITKSMEICNYFAPLTNCDRIRQSGDEALMLFKKKHKCDCCVYIRSGNCTEPVDRKDRCADGLKQWLNAPAESEGEK